MGKEDSTIPWFQADCYRKFWQMYGRVMQYRHEWACETACQAAAMATTQLSHMVPNYPKKAYANTNSRPRSQRHRSKRRRRAKESNMFHLDDNEQLQTNCNSNSNCESVSEIDQNYLDFLKESMLHRLKLKRKREELKHQEESQLPTNCHSHTDEEDIVDIYKKHEEIMRDLYGTSALRVDAMETTVQCTFDRLSTLHEPKLWPNIPLKLVF